MEENKYTQFIGKYRNEANELKKKMNAAVSDEDMAQAIGGVGGANEATCPVCGKPMIKVESGYGDPFWKCPYDDTMQIVSDAEYIEMIRMLEQAGQTQGIVYPVWWSQVNKKKK